MHKATTVKVIAALLAALVLMFSILPTTHESQTATPTMASNSFVIDNVRIFDGKQVLAATQIEVRDGTIVAIGDAVSADGIETIDASGQTLLPGLIDAHTHSFASARADALRFGVTTVLDMFTDPTLLDDAIAQRESDIATGEATLFSAGMLATTAGGHGTQYGIDVDTLANADEASKWVKRRKAEGSDYIKLVYIPESRNTPSIDLEVATAVIRAAHANDMLAVAHISTIAAADELLRAGIDGLVHIYFDAAADADFLARARDANLFVIPTLTVTSVIDGNLPGQAILDDDALSPLLSQGQLAMLSQSFGISTSRGFAEQSRSNVSDLHKAGITILAGSDAPNPSTAHGITLHQELDLLVQAGHTPIEALRAATSIPADTFGLTGRGTIAVGQRADLLLVNGDPTTDITVTRNIERVFHNGFDVERELPEPATSLPATAAPSELSDFEDGITAADGFIWSVTSDDMMGGKSSAVIAAVQPGAGGSAGAMAVTADTASGFAFPWSGAFLAAQSTSTVENYGNVAFDIRGTPARMRLMLFSTGVMGAPPTIEFDITNDWQRVTLPIDDVTGFDRTQFAGFAIVTPAAVGTYEFMVDNVALLP
ncbi:MAG: amidohydrolase family protein [Pseudomonadota bacterium]